MKFGRKCGRSRRLPSSPPIELCQTLSIFRVALACNGIRPDTGIGLHWPTESNKCNRIRKDNAPNYIAKVMQSHHCPRHLQPGVEWAFIQTVHQVPWHKLLYCSKRTKYCWHSTAIMGGWTKKSGASYFMFTFLNIIVCLPLFLV